MPRAAAAAPLAAALLLAGTVAGAFPGPGAVAPLAREGDPGRHTPDTLWERIDGEAELYRAYGLVASEHARYAHPADPDRAVELSVYTMGDPLGAFGLLAAFRPRACERLLALGNGACADDYQGILWHGAAFVVADAAGPAETRAGDVRRALEAAAADLGAPPPRPEPLLAFARTAPPRSIRFHPQHLFGREALPPGLEGEAAGVVCFVATGGAPAAEVLDRYAPVLGGARRGVVDGRPLLAGADPALGPVTLVAGPHGLVGARALPDAPGLAGVLGALAARSGDLPPAGAW